MSLYEALAWFGGIQIILQGLFAFLSKIWINRIHEKDKLLAAKDIEKIRYEIEAHKSTMQLLTNSIVSNQSTIHSKKVEAISLIWDEVISIKNNRVQSEIIYEMLTDDEIPSALNNPRIFEMFNDLDGRFAVESLGNKRNNLEKTKPFISDKLWFLFFCYRAFNGRIAYLLEKGKKQGRLILLHEDSGIISIVSNVLSEHQVEEFKGLDLHRLNFAKSIIEKSILLEIEDILTARKDRIKGIEDYQALIRELQEKTKPN